MQIHVCLMSLPSHDRKSDRDGVDPPLWSHEALCRDYQQTQEAASWLKHLSVSQRLGGGGGGGGVVIQQMFSVVLLHLQEALPPCALSAPPVIFMDSGFSISV